MLQDTYPLLLPHVHISGNCLWLGDNLICGLSAAEEQYCLLANGTNPHSDMIARSGVTDLQAGISAFILYLHEPARAIKESPLKKMLVISPNPQTGYLSTGGTLLKHTDAEAVHVICFSRTNDCSFPQVFKSTDDVSAIRRDEAEICSRICGAKNIFLHYPAYSLRKTNWPRDSSAEAPNDLAANLGLSLYALIKKISPDIIFAPAAIGGHPDHSMIHRIVLSFFKEDRIGNAKLLLYQDFPYTVAYNMVDDFLYSTECSFVKLEDHFEDVSGHVTAKELLYDACFSILPPAEKQLALHILRRNRLACPGLRQAEAIEHFYEVKPFI